MNYPASIIAALTALAVGLSAHAQNAPRPTTGQDNALGKQIAACAGCHGAQGEGNVSTGFPAIAGQSPAYLAHQLRAYADGSRNNAVMGPIAKGLTPQDIDAVSSYYASLPPSASRPAAQPASEDVMKRGRVLATIGDDRIGVQNCANCHGPGGIGGPPIYPYLASQIGSYLVASLQEWKSGARKTDPSQQMNLISKRLSDRDIAAVAAYFSAQPAPPSALTLMGNAPAKVGPANAPRAQQPSVPVQGIGIEQGAPTTGGGQGPGGGGGASGSGPSGSPTGEAK